MLETISSRSITIVLECHITLSPGSPHIQAIDSHRKLPWQAVDARPSPFTYHRLDMWLWVKTLYPVREHQNSWDLWM